jgi:hypothetical protein
VRPDELSPISTATVVSVEGGLTVSLDATDDVGLAGIDYPIEPRPLPAIRRVTLPRNGRQHPVPRRRRKREHQSEAVADRVRVSRRPRHLVLDPRVRDAAFASRTPNEGFDIVIHLLG